MKLLTLLIFIISVFSGYTTKDNSESNKLRISGWKRDNLKGRVKSVNENSPFKANITNGNSHSRTEGITIYNELGYEIERISGANGYKTIYKYDKDENLIEVNCEGSYKYIYNYKYDNKGNISEKTENNYSKDYKGDTVEEDDKIVYTYSSIDGKLLGAGRYNNKSQYVGNLDYDDNGNVLEDNYTNIHGVILKRIDSKFNKDNKIIEAIYYGLDLMFLSKSTFEYDNNGNVIRIIITSGPKVTIATFKYKYDHNGNWTRMETFTDKKQTSISYRTYEYFK